MGLFNRFMEPIVLKESDHLKKEYEFVKSLCEKNNNEELKLKLKQLEYGLKGEENILYELKNSHLPMYIMHDINLEFGKFKSQIDYIIITKSNIYIIESKNLFGDIKIDINGNFIRSYKIGDKVYKEGIYSPITQNEKHLELLKLIGYENKNMIDKLIFDKLFYKYYKSLVVLSNSKTILNDKEASYKIKDKVVKVDRLIDYIKEHDKLSKETFTNKEMKKFADGILSHHQEPFVYYDILYKDYINEKDCINTSNDNKKSDEELKKELKKYRYYLANKNNIAAYKIFSDKVLDLLVLNKPKSIKELLLIKGIGKDKSEKYGLNIIKIIKKYI